jgi:hypothetical protein
MILFIIIIIYNLNCIKREQLKRDREISDTFKDIMNNDQIG